MARGRPRRAPYPYDVEIAGEGYMLGRQNKQQQTELVAVKLPTVEGVTPTDYSYSSMQPHIEAVQSYEDLSLGYGLKIQQGTNDRRYRYGLNSDLSVGEVWLSGPYLANGATGGYVTPSTRDTTHGIVGFFEIGEAIFANNGRYILQRTSDATTGWNTAQKDFGATTACVDVLVHRPSNTDTTYAYLAMGDSTQIFRYTGSGTAFSQHSGTAIYSRGFARVGSQIWRALDTNYLTMLDEDADPWAWDDWGSDFAYYVGDANSGINALITTVDSALAIVKTDGIYSLDTAGDDHEMFPFLRFAPSSDNGKGYGQWLNSVYVPFREGLMELGPDWSIKPMGPELLTTNDSPVSGRITAACGHDTLNLYAGLYNPDSDAAYLMKFGAWVQDETGQGKRLDVWHGSITPAFTGKKITALHKSTVGAPAGHSRMYIGFDDGCVSWFDLPCTPNPAACSSYKFSTANSYIYLPTMTSQFANDPKAFRAVTMRGMNFAAARSAQFLYRTAPSADYGALSNTFDSALREKVAFPNDTSGEILDPLVVMSNTSSNTCLQLTGLGIHYAVRQPEVKKIYQLMVLADDNLPRRDGSIDRGDAETLRANLIAACESPGTVSLVLPDETLVEASLTYAGETMAWNDRLRQWQSAIAIEAIALDTTDTYGTYLRLAQHIYNDLAALTYTGWTTI